MLSPANISIARGFIFAALLGVVLPPQLVLGCSCIEVEPVAVSLDLAENADLPDCCRKRLRAHCESDHCETAVIASHAHGCSCCDLPGGCDCAECGCLVYEPQVLPPEFKPPAIEFTLKLEALPSGSSYASLGDNATAGASQWRLTRGHPVGLNVQSLFCVWTL